MTDVGLTTGAEFLRESAKSYFQGVYGNPKMYSNCELHRDLMWTPSLRFLIHEQIHVFVEPSENSPYPRILELKANEVRRFPSPIQIYSVCPAEILMGSAQMRDVKRLQEDGFGLLSVDANGVATRQFSTIPLIQIISDSEIKMYYSGLTPRMRQRVSEAFDDYRNKPVNGVRTLTEIVEGIVVQAGKDAVKKNFISASDISDRPASILDAMHNATQLQNARARIGGVRSYIAEYRNLSHHWPKNSKSAHKKYSDCRHAFLDGVKQLQRFREAMRHAGLTGGLPRS